MIKLPGALDSAGLNADMLLQVHDELVFEVPEAEVDALSSLVRDKMESVFQLRVPLVVDLGYGENWRVAH